MDYRYWDSATFLGWLSEEPDKVPDCKPVLEAAEAGSITLVTSAVTIVEVFWLRGHEKVDASHARKIESFFRHSWIVVREVDRFIAEAARELLWKKNIKPYDAIHLATALRQDVTFDQFDTFDNGLIKLSGTLGDPPLTIGRPNLSGRLPLFEKDENK
jgi:predicted nucleic acid-binding protein